MILVRLACAQTNTKGVSLLGTIFDKSRNHRSEPDIGWFEVHSENFFYDNFATYQLEQIADKYPLSLHGVGLSLGSVDALGRQTFVNPTTINTAIKLKNILIGGFFI
jgi:uncharacterized protein (UPF0276 family)